MKNLQYPSSISEWTPSMRLIPPKHEDFAVYGDPGVQRRVRAWAYEYRYALVSGLPKCAHAFYMMHCPGRCSALSVLDHVDLWIECGTRRAKPFLLAHPYMDDPHEDPDFVAYAHAHGLLVERGSVADHWYGERTPPVRLSSQSETVPFPIELVLPTVLALSPIGWRCEKIILGGADLVERCQRDHEHQGDCSLDADDRDLESLDPAFVAAKAFAKKHRAPSDDPSEEDLS